jgi:hypothetical protein
MVAWDSESELRVFGLKEIGRESYDAFQRVFVLPPPPVELASERVDELSLLERRALATNLERVLYIVTADLTGEIHGVRRLAFSTWLALLELRNADVAEGQ